MVNEKRVRRSIFLTMVLAAVLSCVGFYACGGNGESDTPPSQKTDLQSSKEESSADNEISAIPAGWKTFQVDECSISIPGSWGGDEDANIWWPGEGNLDMGKPDICVHCGSSPIMPDTKFDDKVNFLFTREQQERKNVSVSGCSGYTCSWEYMGTEHLGLFLEENVDGGIGLLHFVDCQAPVSDFDEYREVFEKIIGSFKL